MIYNFDASLETGNSLIDTQHKELIKAINDLHVACTQGKGRTEIEKMLNFLVSYTDKHFGDEENLQAKYKYPDMFNHKRYHAQFKQTVKDCVKKLDKEGVNLSLIMEINTKAGDWLVQHIKVEDKKVAAHIKANS